MMDRIKEVDSQLKKLTACVNWVDLIEIELDLNRITSEIENQANADIESIEKRVVCLEEEAAKAEYDIKELLRRSELAVEDVSEQKERGFRVRVELVRTLLIRMMTKVFGQK